MFFFMQNYFVPILQKACVPILLVEEAEVPAFLLSWGSWKTGLGPRVIWKSQWINGYWSGRDMKSKIVLKSKLSTNLLPLSWKSIKRGNRNISFASCTISTKGPFITWSRQSLFSKISDIGRKTEMIKRMKICLFNGTCAGFQLSKGWN